jgi:hypothetical protein
MKPIKKPGSLKLNKETLRSLSSAELGVVNGASAGGQICISDVCPTITDITDKLSIVGRCGSNLTHRGDLDPDISRIGDLVKVKP